MLVLLLDNPASWADAVAALPAPGALPARTVLVPSERHAHSLRRALARSGRGAVLAGTRFVGPLTAAEEVLRGAGVAFEPGEEALRPGRLLALFCEELRLEHFDVELFRRTRGWDEAFARAIATLEGAGLEPADLPADTAHARDVARIWTRVAEEAGSSWSAARICREAAAVLVGHARAWPYAGQVLAAVTGHESGVEARFICAIPGLTLAVWRRRPVSERHLWRVQELFGEEARAALAAPLTPTLFPRFAEGEGALRSGRRELEVLRHHLFAQAEILSSPDRPRSSGPDGTVHLEEHAGVDAELEATVAWVTRQILEAKRALEEIAVLVPAQDPLAQLVADRLARLSFDGGSLPVHVAGGTPAVSTAAGARVLAVLGALEAHLAAEPLAVVLPALRLDAPEGAPKHLTHGAAMELAYSLGTVGGNAARPEGALEWSGRASARIGELEAALARARSAEDSEAREAWRLERALTNLRAVRPALDALVGVARKLADGAPLAAVWDVLHSFLARSLLAPGEGAPVAARLAESLAPACAGALGEELVGEDALAVVKAHLLAMRVPRGRFGEPAVYVGTVESAAGIAFGAVRAIGLCEGALPSSPREDPVVPETLRAALERTAPGRVLRSAADRASAQVHALFAAVQGTRDALALSAPRVDLARTEREPAALFVDAAAALARPDASTGKPAAPVPDAQALRRDAFLPARAAAASFRAARPVSDADWLDRVARVAPELPPAWRGPPFVALDRVATLRSPAGPAGAADGVLGPGSPFPPVPGVDPSKPISASALQQLLACPRLFLMRRILHWDEPAGAPPLCELDPLSFGTLVHRVHEELYRAHGVEIDARARTLAHWQEVAAGVAGRAFEAFLSEYPLLGEEVRKKERARLGESVRTFVEYDWKGAPARRFVGVELAFGYDAPLTVDAGGAALHVGGYIDRVDVEGEVTLVRDLKTGRAYPRVSDEKDPTPARDVQLGLYQLAAKRLARAWNAPRNVIAAYAYANGRGDVEERAFRADAAALEDATQEWLATAAAILHERSFVSTPHQEDCTYCPFEPVCGAETPRRAAACLEGAEDGALARFRVLKDGDKEGE
jgi:hypothetical protein